MAQISKESIERILESTDIVDVVSSYLQLKRAGSQFRANCPFHNEKTPSFYVNPARQNFHCFGCGKGGDAIAFVRDYENLPFADAVRKLAQKANVQLVEEVSDPKADRERRSRGRLMDLQREAAAFFHERLLEDPAARHARAYLKSRGFGREMAERWTVGWMPENPAVFLDWARAKKFTGRQLVDGGLAAQRDENNRNSGLYVRFKDRLMFPVRNEIGDVIAFSGRQIRHDPNSGKYVNSPETAIFKKSNVLFALDRAKKQMLKRKSVLLCEGQLDVISCHEQGIDHAIAPLGTAFTPQHAKILRRYTSNVVICYDADAAGVKASDRAFRELATEGLSVRVVEMPAEDDPDTFLKAHGPEAFQKLLDEAREFFDFKMGRARALGQLDSAGSRAEIVAECASLLAAMTDPVSRDHQINVAATHLQTSASALREAIAKVKRQTRKPAPGQAVEEVVVKVEPTPLHRIVAYLCNLALTSGPAQHFLAEQFETLHEAQRWLEGIPLLESILAAAPDPASNASVNMFRASLSEADRRALTHEVAELDGVPVEDGLQGAERALSLLSGTVLQRRDAAVKAALKQPGLTAERMKELIEEAKEIGSMMRGAPRHEFDDELAPSTYKPKQPPWKKKWEDRKGA